MMFGILLVTIPQYCAYLTPIKSMVIIKPETRSTNYLKTEVNIMKIAVICANGKEGKLIVKEAVERGLDVTAVVRGENKSAASKVIQKDLLTLHQLIWNVLML